MIGRTAMPQSQAKFVFGSWVPMAEVEATLRLAQIAAESMHGEDRVRLETCSRVDLAARACFIDTITEVGRTLAAIFGGYVRREFGESAVLIERAM
jgi:hypothetical protein